MHLLVQESRRLDEDEAAVDLGHAPADLLFLSFSDSDLGAAAAAWAAMNPLPSLRPSLRLVNLAQLRHPMSVDLYADRVASHARAIVLRLLGGLDYWRYGAEELSVLCRERGIPLAVLAGDERDDVALSELGTVTPEQRARLDAFLRQGGPANLRHALGYAAHLAGLCVDAGATAEIVDVCGVHEAMPDGAARRAVVVFYRAWLLAGDLAPITALAAALRERGLAVATVFVASLKHPDCAAFVADRMRAWLPHVVLNATAFSAGDRSPLRLADAAILQVVLCNSSNATWAAASRGLSQADLAMHVVLPELDGHLLTGAVSFKAQEQADPALQFSRLVHAPEPAGIALAADRAAGWARLATTPRAERRIAIVLSDYPGGGQRGHAVGLDTFASLAAILRLLCDQGFDAPNDLGVVAGLRDAPATPFMALAEYRARRAALPEPFRAAVTRAWGEPADDLCATHARHGRFVLAIQPDRGEPAGRKAGYHDPDRPPCHAYVAFYLWLREVCAVDAIVHLGAHGTLEWLPGKAAALSPSCGPRALLGGVPMIYPFIVNNPGEAAAAKRRLGAAIIGHLTPPLRSGGLHGEAAALERLIDEFAAADGLDRRRAGALRRDILARAALTGLLAESGVAAGVDDDAALARLDAYLCDVKDLQVRDGLHVFGVAPADARRAATLAALQAASPAPGHAARLDACAAAERDALLAALDGRFVAPGPGGAPSRGRADVLPTGRNLYSVDPRAVPTVSAVALAEGQAAEFLRRFLQDHGDWPRRIVLDLWGSATMRTGGEAFALALLLLGVRPTRDDHSGRVTGFEIVPLALLDRPRVDVTLRVSGLFRDAFETQIRLFDAAVRAVAARDEAADWNPLAGASARVFGPAPGCYGAGTERRLAGGDWTQAAEIGAAYLDGSGFAYGRAEAADRAGFAAAVANADALLHVQDHAETDLLESLDVAGHAGGFAAAAAMLGAAPAVYLADTARPEATRVRTMAEEVARVVRGRAANPAWIAGMARHGYRGAAEIARTIDALHAFAATLPERFDRQFELLHDATLGDAATNAFLRAANPAAHSAMRARFLEARRRGLWHPRRNDWSEE